MPSQLHSASKDQVYRYVRLFHVRLFAASSEGRFLLTDPRHDHDVARLLFSHGRQCCLDDIQGPKIVGLELIPDQMKGLLRRRKFLNGSNNGCHSYISQPPRIDAEERRETTGT